VGIHFIDILEVARRPFLKDTFVDAWEKMENQSHRQKAIHWLGWETFFRTFFGKMATVGPDGGPARIGRGLDEDHPLVTRRSASISPSKISMDLAHCRVWHEIDFVFDSIAYVGLAAVKRLRFPSDRSTESKPVSYAQVGRESSRSWRASTRSGCSEWKGAAGTDY
jgi:hypothetical protein